jgi:hypothetical protein
MGIEDLTQLEILQSVFAIIFVSISLILGFRILFKYFTLKNKELITIGLTWILMTSPWWGPSISFILIVLFDFGLNQFIYLFIGTAFLPLTIICWVYSFCHIAYPHLKKKIMSTYIVICVIYEIFLIIFLLIDPEIVGTMEGSVNARHNLYALLFDIFILITALTTALLLTRILIKSEEPPIRLKGWLLAIGITSFSIGAILDAALTMNALTLVLVRILLISSAIEYYMSFLLPTRIANWIENRNV